MYITIETRKVGKNVHVAFDVGNITYDFGILNRDELEELEKDINDIRNEIIWRKEGIE